MPRISRMFIKAGMIYFLLSMVAGVLLEIDRISFPALLPLFWHMLMLGWITQIIIGVSIWMYPGRSREEGFAPHKWSWMTFIFLNAGLLLRVIAEPALMGVPDEPWNMMVVVSAVLQVLGGLAYLVEIWPRVQSKDEIIKRRSKK